MQKRRVQYLGWEDPLEEGKATTPVFLPGEVHGQRSLVGHSPWGRTESDTTEHKHESTASLHMGGTVPKALPPSMGLRGHDLC